ncbi:hypothetical protein A4H97_09750 [Niastella yeongjuensis]|uniref:Outer membrane protein beta-barrel domain-containing protein n=1 Tax=Niastella yeongjuensis TaxID=354355 RepID=A0A1V9EEU0_9BACT|nr:outer membrane beta-barrel protein [Niastella yeongjuensis]OQP44640.1 hypothetical protein A4H97_09750 [Niastella yeongjuensis]SEO80313.1 Outer membrane receptor proteins, mostly Fe transport [Niastella yeongjuensis]
MIRGRIIDTTEKKDLHNSIVALIDLADTTLYRSVRTNESGYFELTQIPAGRYTLLIAYPKMADYLQDLTIADTSIIDLKTIPMVSKADLLQEVVVRAGYAIRMRGDTLEYNADSFAVKPGANVEEMLKRLPGILIDKDGKIIAQGKEVQKILVDGDEFFSADPKFASRYLQADAIDKVQVFDDKSERAKFTGIDDGQRTKTINLKLKKDRKNGVFGKLSTGSNGDDYYQHEAMGALFNGARKISLFGLSSKTGKQDLNYGDLNQYVTEDYEIINDGVGGFSVQGGGSRFGGENTASGLPSVQSGGAHYSDKWNEGKQKLNTNYRVKQVNATGWSNGTSTNVLVDGTSFTNKNESQDNSYSFTQKGSGSFIFAVDSFSTVKVSANGSLGNNNSFQSNLTSSTNEKDILVNNTAQTTRSNGTNKAFGSNISYQRKFRKEGRTLSFNLQQEYKNALGDAYNFSANNYYDPSSGLFKNADTLDQLQQSNNQNESYAGRLIYSDALSNKLRMGVEYGFKNNIASNVFSTLNKTNEKFSERVDSLSNNYIFGATTHITGATLAFIQKKINITLGGRALFTHYNQEDNDLHNRTTRRFINLSPQMTLYYNLKSNLNVGLNYNGQTVQPTLDQLQPLQKSSNKLNVVVGNPDLRPAFQHNANVNFFSANMKKGSFLSTNFGVNYTSNSITTSILIDSQNRTTTRYINMNSIPALNINTAYNWMLKKYHVNASVSLGANKNASYTIQNDQKLKNENLNLNAGLTLSHEWKNVMYWIYRGNVNKSIGWSDIAGSTNTRTLFHTHTINATNYLPWHMELANECTFNFQPKNGSFNTHFNTIQWNAFIRKKFLRNDQAVIQLAANDILNNNTGYTRSVTGSNVSESNRFVIKRYWLLSLTWNFSKSLKQ